MLENGPNFTKMMEVSGIKEREPEKIKPDPEKDSPTTEITPQEARESQPQPEINEKEYEVKKEWVDMERTWDDEDLPENLEANTWTTVVEDISSTYDKPTKSHSTMVRLKEFGSPIPEKKFPGGKCLKDHEYKITKADIDGESRLVMISDETEIAALEKIHGKGNTLKAQARKWQANTETWGEKNREEIEQIKAKFDKIFSKNKPQGESLGSPSKQSKESPNKKPPINQYLNI